MCVRTEDRWAKGIRLKGVSEAVVEIAMNFFSIKDYELSELLSNC